MSVELISAPDSRPCGRSNPGRVDSERATGHPRRPAAGLATQRKEFSERFTALDQQIAELRERMAHLEGLLDGLREAIAIRQGAA